MPPMCLPFSRYYLATPRSSNPLTPFASSIDRPVGNLFGSSLLVRVSVSRVIAGQLLPRSKSAVTIVRRSLSLSISSWLPLVHLLLDEPPLVSVVHQEPTRLDVLSLVEPLLKTGNRSSARLSSQPHHGSRLDPEISGEFSELSGLSVPRV